MPPKKSEQRKSDVSTARFAPIDDPTLAMSPASGAAGKDAGKPASAAGGQAASEGSASAQAPAAASQKKDAEKKDKTADREAAVTIEVRCRRHGLAFHIFGRQVYLGREN